MTMSNGNKMEWLEFLETSILVGKKLVETARSLDMTAELVASRLMKWTGVTYKQWKVRVREAEMHKECQLGLVDCGLKEYVKARDSGELSEDEIGLQMQKILKGR